MTYVALGCRRAAAVVGEGDAALLELRVERLELVLLQLQILHRGAELGQVETAGLFAGVENRCECLASHRRQCSPQPAEANPLSERDIWRRRGPRAILTRMAQSRHPPVRTRPLASKGSSNRRLQDAYAAIACCCGLDGCGRARARFGLGKAACASTPGRRKKGRSNGSSRSLASRGSCRQGKCLVEEVVRASGSRRGHLTCRSGRSCHGSRLDGCEHIDCWRRRAALRRVRDLSWTSSSTTVGFRGRPTGVTTTAAPMTYRDELHLGAGRWSVLGRQHARLERSREEPGTPGSSSITRPTSRARRPGGIALNDTLWMKLSSTRTETRG